MFSEAYSEDSLEGLPDRYNYLREVALKYTRRYWELGIEKWRQSIEKLTSEELKQIADAYREIVRRGDAAPLSEWVAQRDLEIRRARSRWSTLRYEARNRGEAPPPEPPQCSRFRRLFELFDYLALLGAVPFASGEVRYCPPEVPLDWSKLPPQLAYLASPAMKWGHYGADERLRLARRITDAEVWELEDLADRLRNSGDEKILNQWSNKFEEWEHQESRLVGELHRLLEDFVPRDGSPGLHVSKRESIFRDLDDLLPP